MDDPLLVRRFERLHDLLRDGQRFVDRHGAASNPLGEILAFDQFHHEGLDAVCLLQPIEGRNVRMIQGGQCPGFARESGHAFGVGRECLRQNFDRHRALEPRIAGAIHLTHAARAEGGENFIRAESGAGGEGQTVTAGL